MPGPDDPRGETDRLLLRRLRIGLALALASIAPMIASDWLAAGAPPRGALLLHASGVAICLLGFWLSGRPGAPAWSVPLALGLFGLACAVRVIVGTVYGDVVTTTVLAVCIAVGAAACMPWGVAAQVVLAVLCGLAVVLNAALVPGGWPMLAGQPAIAVLLALAVSIVISAELRRQRRQLEADNRERRRAEDGQARLAAELEHRVAERTAELKAVIDNSRDAIWSVDRSGGIRVMNRAARERFAVYLGAVFDPTAVPLPATGALWADFNALCARALAGEHVQSEYAVEAPDGWRHALVSAHPVVEGDRIVGAAVFSQDVTQRTRDEEAARQRQAELAHAQRLGTMGEMAAGLAHEINQPLGAIANYAQGAAHRLRAETITPHELLPVVQQIAAEALRAGAIIRNLRELVRKQLPTQVDVDVNALARATAQLVEGEARRYDVAVELDLQADLPHVSADATQIEQVLLNLLLNGIEAVGAAVNGDRRVALRTAAAASGVTVDVRDNGAGLPAPPADVFAPFFTTKATGLGMGLSISRSIIEAHGGRLEAVADGGPGATFRFTLPAAAVPPAAA